MLSLHTLRAFKYGSVKKASLYHPANYYSNVNWFKELSVNARTPLVINGTQRTQQPGTSTFQVELEKRLQPLATAISMLNPFGVLLCPFSCPAYNAELFIFNHFVIGLYTK